MSASMEGKKIIVTGAGRGIGRAIAEELCKAGATVFAISRSKGPLDDLKSKFPQVQIISLDISNWNETRKAVEEIGLVDGVVNNAAGLSHEPLIQANPEVYDSLFKSNVAAVLNICQVVAKAMIAAGKGGSIVNISSNLVAHNHGANTLGLYSSTKAALDRLTKSMALEWAPHSIRANCVAPALVATDMGNEMKKFPEVLQAYLKRIPMGRILEPEDIVGPVLFLLSDAAGQVTGQVLAVDSGIGLA